MSLYPGRRSFASADKELQLAVEAKRIVLDSVESNAIAIGGSVPAPALRWPEGEEVVIQVTNRLSAPTSIHWHGLLIEGVMDGAPGFNGYEAIQPGKTYTYRFHLRQAGTYWYHSHSGLQEQQGMYGTPAGHAMAAPVPATPVPEDGAPPVGWDQAGTLPGGKALSYADLKAFARNSDDREPGQEILVRLTGIMERYIWTLNGRKFEQGEPVRVAYGERVRIRYVNETMMAHPMHLHGMFVSEKGDASARFEAEHDILITQRLIAQPKLEVSSWRSVLPCRWLRNSASVPA